MELSRRRGMLIDSAGAMSLRLPPRPPGQCGHYELLYSTSVFDCHSQIGGCLMLNDRKINVSFSARAEDVIRRFMKVAERTMPRASLVPIMTWHISGTFTNKVTGEVRTFGPGVDVGAIDPKKLTDELIVPMGDLRASGRTSIRRPAEIRFRGRFFCPYRQLISLPDPRFPD